MRIPQETMAQQMFTAFPELKKYDDQMYFIDATINEREVFLTRDTPDIVAEITEAYKQGRSKFIFYMFTEAVLAHIIFKIHRIAEIFRGAIPSENFIYLSGAMNGEEAYENVAQRYNFPCRITIFSASMFHYYLFKAVKNQNIEYSFDINPKLKKFLCFNKLEREQRLRLIERMLEHKFVELGYYSFESENGENFSKFADSLEQEKFPNVKKHKDMFPLRLNINPNRTNPVNVIPDDMEYFKNSYFSIVNETIFYGVPSTNTNPLFHQLNAEYSSIFISEKTYKCLAVKHPFVIFGRPGIIKGLHKLGFKTFSPYFNESYDDIIDDDERFDAIFNEITRLIHLSDDEWVEILKNIQLILEHNHSLFFNSTKYGVTEDTERFFKGGDKEQSLRFEKAIQNCDIMELMPLSNNLDWSLQNKILKSGIELQFPVHLDGGGYEMVDELIDVIRKTGKTFYNRACEWCAGFGVLGFEVLGLGLTKHIVFTDYYHVAIDTCLENARKNHLINHVSGHVSGTINDIPNIEKWDLVVSNPPHVFDKEYFLEHLPGGREQHSSLDNTCRLTVDQNFGVHKEFFKNIKAKLTSDADVYLIEAVVPACLIEWAEQGGLYLHSKHPISFLPNGAILHFKLK
jgi:hypothetical protein